jgi:hypothetical protein
MRRTTVAAAVLSVLALSSVTPAVAAERPVTARADGYGNGYNNVVGDKGAFQRIFVVGDSRIPVYSLDFRRSVAMGAETTYSAVARRSSGVSQVDRAADIAVRSSRIGEVLSDANAEAAAVQLAIWMLTNELDPAPTGAVNAPVRKRAESLAASATAIPGGDRELTIGMTARVSGSGEGRRLTVYVTAAGAALVGIPVSVVVGNTTLDVRTNDDGVAIVKLAGVAAGTGYRATFRWSLPAGSVLVPADGAPVVTTSDAQGTASFRGTIPAPTGRAPNSGTSPAPRPTGPASPKQSPEASPVPSPSPEPSLSPSDGSDTDGGDLVDPAESVIEFTDEDPVPPVEDPSVPRDSSRNSSWMALGAAALLFLGAVVIARRRARG